ncbi:MAG: hypothetical protein AB7O62_20335 [Pirellulales bacterium]
MNAAVLKSLVLANALLLAMPPGWCCRVPAIKDAAVRKSSCCHQQTPERPAPSQMPGQPGLHCCCTRQATLPQAAVAPDHDGVNAVAVLAETALGPLQQTLPLSHALPAMAAGPPLRILNCVWRC